MFFLALLISLFFLAPYAEAHRGNPCLEADYASSAHGCERGVVDIKPDPFHLDSSRLYAEDEDHRHLPRAIGRPDDEHSATVSEYFGWKDKEVAIIPIFDRDKQEADGRMLPCVLIDEPLDSNGLEVSLDSFVDLKSLNIGEHPYPEEGFVTGNGFWHAFVSFQRFGRLFDYERAPFADEGGRYYQYTLKMFDHYDSYPERTWCSNNDSEVVLPSDTSLILSRTFKVYVTDEDESVNNPPVIDSGDFRNLRIFENAPADTVVCCRYPRVLDIEDPDHSRADWKYELTGDGAGDFKVQQGDHDFGEGLPNGLMFSTRALDAETKSAYDLTLRVTDSGGATAEQAFTIKVVDLVNETCEPPISLWPHSPLGFVESPTRVEEVPNVTSWDDPHCEDPSEDTTPNPPRNPPRNSGGSSGVGGSVGGGSSSGGSSGGGSVGGGGSSGGGRASTSTVGICGEEVDTCEAGRFQDMTDLDDQYRWSCQGDAGTEVASCTQDKPDLLIGALENPLAGHVSGVSLISGWFCDATQVEVAFNDGPRIIVPYGSPRADTAGRCGNINTGFGLLWNWNLLGDGEHQVAVFIDGAPWQATQVTVTTLSEEFATGLSATCEVPGFPDADTTTTLEWRESLQGFVITEVE